MDGRIDANGELTSDLTYCSQGNNANAAAVQACTDTADDTFIPLNTDGNDGTTNTAQMVWQYANDQANFHQNFMGAWQQLMTVPAVADEGKTLSEMKYGIRCVTDETGVSRPRCVADLYQQKCDGFAVPNCPWLLSILIF